LLVFARNTKRSVNKNRVHISKASLLVVSGTDDQHALRAFILWGLTLWFIFSCVSAYAGVPVPDRRRDQFPASPARLIVPLSYSYPGIGDGLFLMGNFSNILDTTTDFLAMDVTGDAGGYILQFDEVPIIDQRLYVKLYYQDIDSETNGVAHKPACRFLE